MKVSVYVIINIYRLMRTCVFVTIYNYSRIKVIVLMNNILHKEIKQNEDNIELRQNIKYFTIHKEDTR